MAQLQPYQQGHLDGLCGVYAVVNAVHYLCGPLRRDHAGALVGNCLDLLARRRPLTEILRWGVTINEIAGLLKHIVAPRYPLYRRKPFQRAGPVALETYWQCAETFFNTHRGVVLVAIGGYHDHWTLIRGLSERRVLLFDAGGLQYLRRANCQTPAQDLKRPHTLYPTQTYCLWTE